MVQGEKLLVHLYKKKKNILFKNNINNILKTTILQDDVELKSTKNLAIHSLGRKRTLVINKCTPEDGGTYICHTADDNTSAKLTVQGD